MYNYTLTNPNIFLSGQYTCTGYNYLPDDVNNEKSVSTFVDIQVIRDVFVTLTKDKSSDEVSYGDSIAISCVAEGSRVPFYLQLALSGSPIVTYDKGTVSPSSETVTTAGYTLKFVHEIASVDYTHGDIFSCYAKNLASGRVEKNDNKEILITIGKKNGFHLTGFIHLLTY